MPATPLIINDGYELVDIDTIEPHPRNVNQGDVGAITEMIDASGFYGACMVQRGTGHILAGKHRWLSARAEGMDQVPVIWLKVDDDQALKIMLGDNRSTRLGHDDEHALAELLKDLAADAGLDGTGFDLDDLDQLLEDLDKEPRAKAGDDDVPTRPRKPRCEEGQLWHCGPHRLIVGDSTDPDTLDRLLGDDHPDMIWTDPPYGVAYEGQAGTIINDQLSITDLEQLLRDSLTPLDARTRPGACWYVCAPHGPQFIAFARVLGDLGIWRQTIVWVKNQLVLGRADYHGKHEAICYGYDDTDADAIVYGWTVGGKHKPPPDRTQTTVWEFDRPTASKDHPTMKPVAMVEHAIRQSSRPGSLIADPFAGSGSLMMACHNTGRTSASVELDPKYADVILTRWQEHTGQRPELEGPRGGRHPHDFERP